MLFLVALFCFGAVQGSMVTERDLRKDLFDNYDKLVRPVRDPNTGIVVAAGLSPLFINDLNEKDQILSMETFTLMKWKDDYLQWDPENYNNISVLRVPSDEVWKPDLSLYTAADESGLFPTAPTQVLVYSDGSVMWVPMFTVRSRCPLNKRKVNEYAVCNIKIGSWTYSGPMVDVALYTEKVDMSNFQNIHPDWKLVDVVSNRVNKYYPCCPEPYPSLNFNVTLKKRSEMFYSTTEPIPYTKYHY